MGGGAILFEYFLLNSVHGVLSVLDSTLDQALPGVWVLQFACSHSWSLN